MKLDSYSNEIGKTECQQLNGGILLRAHYFRPGFVIMAIPAPTYLLVLGTVRWNWRPQSIISNLSSSAESHVCYHRQAPVKCGMEASLSWLLNQARVRKLPLLWFVCHFALTRPCYISEQEV